MGGLSAEREISIRSGRAVLSALKELGYNVFPLDLDRDAASRLKRKGAEVAFIALHGRYGEDGCIQGLLELMGIPYTGSGVLASALAMDKAATKTVLKENDIPVPRWKVFKRGERMNRLPALPLVVKPTNQGSTIGVSVVKKRADLGPAVKKARRYGPSVIVEEYIEGRELTVSILDGRAFPVVEIRPKEGLYNYKCKYTKGMTDFIVPAALGRRVEKRVLDAALKAYSVMGCRGAARVDMVLGRDATPYVLEVNTVPGMTETSLLPMAAASAGMSYKKLVEAILTGARLD